MFVRKRENMSIPNIFSHFANELLNTVGPVLNFFEAVFHSLNISKKAKFLTDIFRTNKVKMIFLTFTYSVKAFLFDIVSVFR